MGFLIVLVLLCVVRFKSSPPVQSQSIIIALDWLPNIHHLGLYMSKDLAFDKQMGLEFNLQQPNRINALLAVANGQAHLGVGFAADVVAARLLGLDVLSVAALFPKTTSCLAWKAGRGLDNPKLWEGLTYVGWGSVREDAMLKRLMEQAGGHYPLLKKVVSSHMDFESVLTTGTADLMWIFKMWDGVKAQGKGLAFEVLCPHEIFPKLQHPAPLLIVQKSWANREKPLLQNILWAIQKGYVESFNHPIQSAESMAKWVPEVPYLVWKLAALEAQKVQNDSPHALWGWQDESQWKTYLETLDDLGIISGAQKVFPFHSNEFLPKS